MGPGLRVADIVVGLDALQWYLAFIKAAENRNVESNTCVVSTESILLSKKSSTQRVGRSQATVVPLRRHLVPPNAPELSLLRSMPMHRQVP